MKFSSDYKQIAREALRGNWKTAVLTGFVASLIGGTLVTGSSGSSSGGGSRSSADSLSGTQIGEVAELIVPILIGVATFLIIWGIVVLIIGGAAKLGYAKFNLNLIDKKPASFKDLFSCFNRLGDGFCMNLLVGLFTFLWTMLLIIPGIIKSYSYAMTPYILLEHPEMTVDQAITESRRIMNGNKWNLFCLHFSFIGWVFLELIVDIVAISLIYVGSLGTVLYLAIVVTSAVAIRLFLIPYQEAAQAAFYRDITYVPAYIPREENN